MGEFELGDGAKDISDELCNTKCENSSETNGETNTNDKVTSVPKIGLKYRLDYVFPEKWEPFCLKNARIRHFFLSIIVCLRYLIHFVQMKLKGLRPIMDFINIPVGKPIYGAPIGGIGGGTMGRGYRGEFCRFCIFPGNYENDCVDADQFIITIKNSLEQTICQSLLSTYRKDAKQTKVLESWESNLDPSKCQYTALYPRAWTEYDLSEYGVKLVGRQISPIIPHNYMDSSVPCAVFVWEIENLSDEEKTVTITFAFKNGTANKEIDKNATCYSQQFATQISEGVKMKHSINGQPCTYALGVKSRNGLKVSKCLHFDPNSDGRKVWNELWTKGMFEGTLNVGHKTYVSLSEMGCAVAAQVKISAGRKEIIENTLVWNMPIVTFKKNIKQFKRFYTKYFGWQDATLKMVDYALKNYERWEIEIHNWQKVILEDKELPDWYKEAIFNEMYYIADGGSVWFLYDETEAEKLPEHDPRRAFGRFAYLEGHEYRMFNTYDVHFYSSFALVMNWPELQNAIQYDTRDSIHVEMNDITKFIFSGKPDKRKVMNTVPHDLGEPDEEPFTLINAYNLHPVAIWRDLNPKFVLQVYRDYKTLRFSHTLSADQYLKDMYESCDAVMRKTYEFDTDNDGLIEHSGFPDQTYDTWLLYGSSAYCGGLWLGSLQAMTEICEILGKTENEKFYGDILERAKRAYEKKLWTGSYYRLYDSKEKRAQSIMADQLCGFWYMKCSECQSDILPKENIRATLKTIYKNNVLSHANGTLGAVNGSTPEGKPDIGINQSEECWPGVTYALAATMIKENMLEEAWQTAGGLYKRLTRGAGLQFNTPEALFERNLYRALGYMRPMSIWSMQLAWEQRKKQCELL